MRPTISKLVVLSLNNYKAVKWQIKNPYNTTIVGTVYGSYHKDTQVQGSPKKALS